MTLMLCLIEWRITSHFKTKPAEKLDKNPFINVLLLVRAACRTDKSAAAINLHNMTGSVLLLKAIYKKKNFTKWPLDHKNIISKTHEVSLKRD